MIRGVKIASIPVRNQDASLKFYTEVLGFKVVTDVLSLQELEDIAANYKRVAGFQVEGLNAKPPIVQIRREAPRAAS